MGEWSRPGTVSRKRSTEGHNQGLPARSSVKTVHRTVFRALRTPSRTPPRICLSPFLQGLPARCSVRLCHWHNLRAFTAPGGKSARYVFLLRRSEGGFASHVSFCCAKIPAQGLPARSSLKMCHRHIFRALRTPHRTCRCCGFIMEGLRPLQTTRSFVIIRCFFQKGGVAEFVLQHPLLY